MASLPRITSSMALAGQTFCVLLIFLPFLLWGFLTSWEHERSINADRVLSLTNALSARQTLLTASTQVLLTTLSLAPLVKKGNSAELNDFLEQLDLSQPDYAGFAVFSVNGDTVVSVINGRPRKPLPPQSIREREYFRLAMEKARFSIGEALNLPEGRVVLPMSMPVWGENHQITGLVLAPLDLSVLDRIVPDLLKQNPEQVVIFDRHKQPVYSYSGGSAEMDGLHKKARQNVTTSNVLSRLEKIVTTDKYSDSNSVVSDNVLSGGGQYLFEWKENGTAFVGAVQEIKLSPQSEPYLYIASASEQITLQRFAFERFWLQIVGMVGTFFVAIILSRTIGRRYFSAGLERLAHVAVLTQKGDLKIRNGIVPGCVEIGILASAFDRMLSAQEANTNALKALSRVDPLTGLWNRRRFTEIALLELTRAVRYGHGLAVVMADIDKFKNVNDTYGHASGDEVLRVFAQTLRSAIRETDVVARYGGEEFIFLLPEATGDTSFEVMNRLRLTCAALEVPHELGTIRFTASFGISELCLEMLPIPESCLAETEDAQTACSKDAMLEDTALRGLLQDLTERADAALYRSKQEGRNKVTVWQPNFTTSASNATHTTSTTDTIETADNTDTM